MTTMTVVLTGTMKTQILVLVGIIMERSTHLPCAAPAVEVLLFWTLMVYWRRFIASLGLTLSRSQSMDMTWRLSHPRIQTMSLLVMTRRWVSLSPRKEAHWLISSRLTVRQVLFRSWMRRAIRTLTQILRSLSWQAMVVLYTSQESVLNRLVAPLRPLLHQ
jgi:hypothetical protein